MSEQALPVGWRSDEHGNVYRLLTPSEQAQIERARGEHSGAVEDSATGSHDSAAGATGGRTRSS